MPQPWIARQPPVLIDHSLTAYRGAGHFAAAHARSACSSVASCSCTAWLRMIHGRSGSYSTTVKVKHGIS